MTEKIKEQTQKAIDETKIIEFDYYSDKKEFSHRVGEPYEIKNTGLSEKLYLWDYDREGIRSFILDHISNLKVTHKNFVPRRPSRG